MMNVSSPSVPQKNAASLITACAKGYLQRKKLHIQSLSPGMIHTRIQGGTEELHKIGMQVKERNLREIDILTIDLKHFSSQIIASHEGVNPMTASFGASSKRDARGNSKQSTEVTFPGGYFDYDKPGSEAFKESRVRSDAPGANFRPVGPVKINGPDIPSKPIPEQYLSSYYHFQLPNGNALVSAPKLTENGQPMFPEELEKDPLYQHIETKGGIRRGTLLHADDPNPRCGISAPEIMFSKVENPVTGEIMQRTTPSFDEIKTPIRLVIALSSIRGPKGNGFSLSEWSNVMSRIANLDISPSSALNVDGGGSAGLSIRKNGQPLLQVAQNKTDDGEIGKTLAAIISFKN